jgi:hypothetical protein
MIRAEKSLGCTIIILDNDIIPDIQIWAKLFEARKDKVVLFEDASSSITIEKDDSIFRIITVHNHATTVFACLADMIEHQLCKKISELNEIII